MKRLLLPLLLLVTLSCASSPVGGPKVADPLLDLEQSVRRIPTLHLRYYVETSGAMNMLARGSIEWDSSHLRVDATGAIGQEKKSTRYDRPVDRIRPFSESWVRIGMAHNLYRIMTGSEVEAIDSRPGNIRVDKGHYTFDVIVEGKDIGDADLWVDASGLPLRREQTMQFPQGEMKITERYLWLP